MSSKPKARDGSNPCSDNPSSEWNGPRQHPALKEHQQSCMYVYIQRVLTGFLSLSSQGSPHSSRVMWLRFETPALHQDPEKSRDAEGVAAWMHGGSSIAKQKPHAPDSKSGNIVTTTPPPPLPAAATAAPTTTTTTTATSCRFHNPDRIPRATLWFPYNGWKQTGWCSCLLQEENGESP